MSHTAQPKQTCPKTENKHKKNSPMTFKCM